MISSQYLLKVATISVSDLTDDGCMVSAIVRRAYDNAETDNYRYGDPAYVGPSLVSLLVIDTEKGTSQSPFKELTNVRQTAWAHDVKRLAIIAIEAPPAKKTTTAAKGPVGPPPPDPSMPVTKLYIWSVDRATLAEVPAQSGLTLSFNSGLEWTGPELGGS